MGKDFFISKILTELEVETISLDDVLYGPIDTLKKWAIMAIIALLGFVWIATSVIYFDYKKKHRKYDGKISDSMKDVEGKYNLDTIDNYEDTKKKLEIERKEIQINKEIKGNDPEFSIVKFKSDVCKTFLDMQTYWTEGNLDKIRDIETDELYEQHRKIIEDFSSKNQKNVREDVSIEGCFLNSYSKTSEKESIIVDYVIKMKDYVIQKNEVANPKENKKKTYLYRVTYVRSAATKTDENFEARRETICPNCGAKVKVAVSEYCPYCNSMITSNEYGWVICNIEKTMIK
jgi:hypothetical protein